MTGKTKFEILFNLRWGPLVRAVRDEKLAAGECDESDIHEASMNHPTDLFRHIAPDVKTAMAWTEWHADLIPRKYQEKLAKLSGVPEEAFQIEDDPEFEVYLERLNQKEKVEIYSWASVSALSVHQDHKAVALTREDPQHIRTHEGGGETIRRVAPAPFMIKVMEPQKSISAGPAFQNGDYLALNITPRGNRAQTLWNNWRCLLLHSTSAGELTWLNAVEEISGKRVVKPIVLRGWNPIEFPQEGGSALKIDDATGAYSIYGLFYAPNADNLIAPLLERIASHGRQGPAVNDEFHRAARTFLDLREKKEFEIHRADYHVVD